MCQEDALFRIPGLFFRIPLLRVKHRNEPVGSHESVEEIVRCQHGQRFIRRSYFTRQSADTCKRGERAELTEGGHQTCAAAQDLMHLQLRSSLDSTASLGMSRNRRLWPLAIRISLFNISASC